MWARGFEGVRVSLFVLAATCVPTGLVLRRAGMDGWQIGGLVLLAGWVCCLGAATRVSRDRSSSGGLFPRMDERLGMHARLCAAAEGVGLWPDPVANVEQLWPWRVGRALSGFGALLLACAILIVVPAGGRVVRPVPTNRPPVLAEAEQLLGAMEANEALGEEAVRELREELERMKGRDAKDWFSPGGLEAAAQLGRELEQGGRELAAQMERIQDALQDLRAGQSDEGERSAGERLAAALRAASGTKPGLDKGLEQMLKRFAEGGVKSISENEFNKMQERLSEALNKMGECGLCKKSGARPSADQGGSTSGTGVSEDGAFDTPLTFSLDATRLDAGVLEALPAVRTDGTDAVAGDVLREIRRAPSAEPTESAAGIGGAVNLSTNGAMGAVWRGRPVPPEEAQRLRRYFAEKRGAQ